MVKRLSKQNIDDRVFNVTTKMKVIEEKKNIITNVI